MGSSRSGSSPPLVAAQTLPSRSSKRLKMTSPHASLSLNGLKQGGKDAGQVNTPPTPRMESADGDAHLARQNIGQIRVT
jgi:hypothetical protein